MMAVELLQAAHADYQAGQLDSANAKCAEVLDQDSENAKAHQLRALIARKQGDVMAALSHIDKAIALEPNDAECYNTRANLLAATGQILEAIKDYRQSLSLVPNYLSASINYGQLLIQTKDAGDAVGLFKNALLYHPGHPQLQRGLLYALKDTHQTKDALQLLGQIPQSPDLALTAGQIFMMERQVENAEKAFRAALTFPQTAWQGMTNLTQLGWMRDGKDRAKTIIETTIAENPDQGVFYITGANLYNEMNDRKAAYDLIARGEARFGSQPEFSLQKSMLKIDDGEGEAAFALAETAMAARPGDIGIMSALARSALMTERFDVALQAAKAVQMRLPNDQFWIALEATALRGLGKDYQRLYNMERFIQAYDLEAPAKYTDMAEFNRQLKTALEARHQSQHYPLGQSLRQGTQTSRDLRFATEPVIQDFIKMLERPIKAYMTDMGQDSEHPLMRRNTGDYRLTGAWSVRLTAGGHHVNHVHPEGWISSSYYVEVPEEVSDEKARAGWIKFGEPPFNVPRMTPERFIQPKAGRLVLFPSYMWHGTVPITGNASRLTLPFDAVPA